MHEYAMMKTLIETSSESLAREGVTSPAQVKEILVEVGVLDIHSEESFRQAYEALRRGTLLEKAELTLQLVPARIECAACGCRAELGIGDADGHQPAPAAQCPKCGAVCPVLGGRGIKPVEIAIDEPPGEMA